jgi:hypothetical protein
MGCASSVVLARKHRFDKRPCLLLEFSRCQIRLRGKNPITAPTHTSHTTHSKRYLSHGPQSDHCCFARAAWPTLHDFYFRTVLSIRLDGGLQWPSPAPASRGGLVSPIVSKNTDLSVRRRIFGIHFEQVLPNLTCSTVAVAPIFYRSRLPCAGIRPINACSLSALAAMTSSFASGIHRKQPYLTYLGGWPRRPYRFRDTGLSVPFSSNSAGSLLFQLFCQIIAF